MLVYNVALQWDFLLVIKVDNIISALSSQVSLVQVALDNDNIAWKQDGDWMSLKAFVASEMLVDLPCNILSALLSHLKLKGHAKLSHFLKAEFFLKHMQWSEEAIAETLARLKVRTRKKKEQQEEEAQQAEANGEEPPED